MHALITRLMLFTATLLLSSCLDYEEELTFNENLSGEVLVTLTLPDTLGTKFREVPALFSEQSIQGYLEKASGVRLLAYQYKADRRPEVKLKLAFASLDAWNDAVALHPQASLLAGKFTRSKSDKGVTLERQLGIGPEIPSADLQGFNYVNYTLRFRDPILTTNSPQFNKHGNELRYRYSLDKLLAQQPVMTMTIKQSQPWIFIGLASAAAVFALWKIWATWFKPRKKTTI